jgi:hypothetical protein
MVEYFPTSGEIYSLHVQNWKVSVSLQDAGSFSTKYFFLQDTSHVSYSLADAMLCDLRT